MPANNKIINLSRAQITPFISEAVLVVPACRDAGTESLVAPLPEPKRLVAVDEEESTWNYFAADVITIHNAARNAADLHYGEIRRNFHIERTLDGANV